MSPNYTSKTKSKYTQKSGAESNSKPWLKSITTILTSINNDEFEKSEKVKTYLV